MKRFLLIDLCGEHLSHINSASLPKLSVCARIDSHCTSSSDEPVDPHVQLCYADWRPFTADNDARITDSDNRCDGRHRFWEAPYSQQQSSHLFCRQLARAYANVINELFTGLIDILEEVDLTIIWYRSFVSFPPKFHLELFATLHRLISHFGASFFLVCADGQPVRCGSSDGHLRWVDVLNGLEVSYDVLPMLFCSRTQWIGQMQLKADNELHNAQLLAQIALQSVNDEKSCRNNQHTLKDFAGMRKRKDISFCSTIDVMKAVHRCHFPLHMLSRTTFKVVGLDDSIDYNILRNSVLQLTEKGIYVLCRIFFEIPSSYPHEWKGENVVSGTITDVTATFDNDDIDSVGCINLLLHGDGVGQSDIYLTPLVDCIEYDQSSLLAISNANEIMGDSDGLQLCQGELSCWPELIAWKQLEVSQCLRKSLVRLQSGDLLLGGIPVPAVSSSHGNTKTVNEIQCCFDSSGISITKDQHDAIPILQDRLMVNVKPASMTMALTYTNALNSVGHGVDYCLDSHNAIKMDSRLTRIKNRYVLNETKCSWDINLLLPEGLLHASGDQPFSCKLSQSTEDNDNNLLVSNTANLDEISGSTQDALQVVAERRSDRHKRRLRTIVEATVAKHGHVKREHPKFKKCSDRLYSLCKSFLKDLKSSEGLKEKMKQIAKANVKQVVEFEVDNWCD